jgi:phospholipid transport system substrate-binding protein
MPKKFSKQGVEAMRLAIFGIVIFSAIALVSQDTFCQGGMPTECVRAILEEVMMIQTDPRLKGQEFRNKRRTAIKKIIAKNFHFDAMAKQALGQHWQALNEAKRSEFKAIFQDLFQESYTRLVLDFLGREKIIYNKEDIEHGRALVKTTITRLNEEIPVDYSLTTVEEKWLVEDVAIDGVSIVKNYQKSFSRVIQQESFEGLLKKMRLQQQAIDRTS